MNNQQKNELAQIVKDIPAVEIKSRSVVALWKRHASDFEYSTFRNYLKAIRLQK